MTNTTTATREELRHEVADCNAAIKAFICGTKWLAPANLSDAPSLAWIKMHRNVCIKALADMRIAA